MAVARRSTACLIAAASLLLWATTGTAAAWCNCPKTEKPVCGQDMQTYSNECIATKCVRTDVKSQGKCPDTCLGTFKRSDCNCGGAYSPVCARGQTYQNACAAECSGYGPDCYYQGICKYNGGQSVASQTPAGPSRKFREGDVNGRMPDKASPRYNYGQALHMNYLFFESMRSGMLKNNRIKWRGNSCFNCKGLFNEDLRGGYYEAGGSYLKMTQVIAYSVAMIGWAVDEGLDGHRKAGELGNALAAIKWGTDYLIKGHVVKNGKHYMVAQLGHKCKDFAYFGPPELYEKFGANGTVRTTNPFGDRDVGYISQEAGKRGSEITGMSAAALIIAARVFKRAGVAPYKSAATIASLEKHARELYSMATKYPGSFKDHTDLVMRENHVVLWGTKGYKDDLTFAAAWMYRHTGNKAYLTAARKYYDETPQEQTKEYNGGSYAGYHFDGKFMWPATHVLLAKVDKEQKQRYLDRASQFLNQYTGGGIPTTDRGLAYPFAWGALRVAANAAFLSLLHGRNPDVPAYDRAKYFSFGVHQINYMLGDSGRSYLIGFGKNNPTHLWHKFSFFPRDRADKYSYKKTFLETRTLGPQTQRSCFTTKMPWYVSESEYAFRSNVLPQVVKATGALYGSPLLNETIVAGRDYAYAEPTIDGNAGLTGALALLAQYFKK